MVLKELIKELQAITKVHPESKEAMIWAEEGRVLYVGYDRRHKPARVKLESK